MDEPVKKPATRADCRGPGICPVLRCKWNLALEVTEAQTIQVRGRSWMFKQRAGADFVEIMADAVVQYLEAGNPSCALDVAESEERLLREIGELWQISKERVRQLETSGQDKMRSSETLRLLHQELEESIMRRPHNMFDDLEEIDVAGFESAVDRFAGKHGRLSERCYGPFLVRNSRKVA